ncbi:DUF6331 family protein [Hymenobacter sp. J193]|uniref:DUF6331 family protein n=1 Tax=Hymenobacter sp. J193 TaxID=2898429 RepID=UPI0021508663|nr:DUF6331 family protein [Hymenobacter sp. J193]MCR5890288.1 DUF6331 family protein [Hymenobacter sp. J193]MCR5890449.1 DUF6331 family protein [Hymenobacter sp. J193]
MPKQDSLRIGTSESINLMDFDPLSDAMLELGRPEATEAGALALTSLDIFWNQLEVDCVAQCCGVYAFDWWPNNILKAAQGLNKQEVVEELRQMEKAVYQSDKPIVCHHRLNQLFARASFLQLQKHLLSILTGEGAS